MAGSLDTVSHVLNRSPIGVLDLQGGVAEHLGHLGRLGIPAVRVKKDSEFDALAGLIIPGGESTCLGRLLRITGLDQAIRARFEDGLKLWGTCAGTILLAKRISGESPYLGLIDIDVERNAFGGQLESFNITAEVPAVAAEPVPLTFIRAPKITRLGRGVRSLLRIEDYHAAVEDDAILATVFHPELTASLAFHRHFAAKCGLETTTESEARWHPGDWTHCAPLPHRT